MISRIPVFPRETRNRLVVQSANREHPTGWDAPQPATLDDLVLAIRELTAEQQAHVVGMLGLVPQEAATRLTRAEWVLEALEDAQLAIDRFREFRKQFPEKKKEE